MSVSGRRDRVWLGVAVVGVLSIVFSTIPAISTVSAAQITSRTLTLQAGASDAGSKPGGVVNHLFTFTVPSSATVGSIQFLYCTTADGSCTTPTGLSTTSATLGTSTGATFTSVVATTNGAPYLTRTAALISGPVALTEQLLTVTNPSTTASFYVRISTFAATNATGSPIDTGNVAASTAAQIVLTGIMPESLVFCTGATISTTAGIPDCTTATSGAISFSTLFSSSAASTATSQMAASTNAGTGYNITVNGTTLTSGSNTITAMTAAAAAVVGTRQFGMNLVANTTASSTPAVGVAVTPAANGTNYKGEAKTGYATPDQFEFNTGNSVADSAYSGAGPTDAQIYTVSYIVNVSGGVTAGTYTTTLTYICTPTF